MMGIMADITPEKECARWIGVLGGFKPSTI
jgi:hypothetical protein